MTPALLRRPELLSLCAVLTATPALAHFWLEAPQGTWSQAAPYGDPQKTAPCGNDGTATATNAVTTVTAGDMLQIRIRETIFHPGHYRVSLGLNGPQDIPAAPPVTPTAADQCASTTVQNPAVFPVIADGQLNHGSAFAGAQTFSVRIPDNVSCTNCTLQVLEFMSSHGAPCFYYHCATLKILPRDAGVTVMDAGVTPTDAGATMTDAGTMPTDGGAGAMDAGTMPGADAGVSPTTDGGTDPGMQGGCGCSSGGGAIALAALALAAWLRRRR